MNLGLSTSIGPQGLYENATGYVCCGWTIAEHVKYNDGSLSSLHVPQLRNVGLGFTPVANITHNGNVERPCSNAARRVNHWRICWSLPSHTFKDIFAYSLGIKPQKLQHKLKLDFFSKDNATGNKRKMRDGVRLNITLWAPSRLLGHRYNLYCV